MSDNDAAISSSRQGRIIAGEVQHKAQRVGRNCFVQFYGPSDNEIYGTKPIFVNKINESVQTLLG
jgi:hypothetical protein